MRCPRCLSVMVFQKFYGPHEHFWGWRCIYCGEILDQTIMENRNDPKRLTRVHEHLLSKARLSSL